MSDSISRRTMLKQSAAAAAASYWVFALDDSGAIVKAASRDEWKPDHFSKKEIERITKLCETIIPETDTPGAAAARVHEYIDFYFSVADDDEQDRFEDGLKWLDKHCKRSQDTTIQKAEPQEMIALLETVSDANSSIPEDLQEGAAFFRELKRHTITGYYTSREGRVHELGLPEHTMMTTYEGCTHADGEHDD